MLPIAVCLLSTSLLSADDVKSIPADEVTKWGARFAKLADKIENPQIKIVADAGNANGVHVPDKFGIMIVPQQELKESEELAARFKSDSGAALAYLFAYHMVPVVDGQQIEADRLRSISFADEQGTERSVYTFLLTVRQLPEGDYRLYVYGKDEKPIVDARFSEGAGPGPEPVAVEIKDSDKQTREGKVVVTVFGKYEASFRARYKED